jgi:hypothetical protein
MTRLSTALAAAVFCGCTASVTTTKADSFGGKFQTPIGWTIESGPGRSAILKQPNGAGTVILHEFPQGTSCDTALRETRQSLSGVRPWKQSGGQATVVVAGINEGPVLGAALCEITAAGTFAVSVSAPKSVWIDVKDDLYKVAESYRREDKPVFNAAPLRRVNPDGTIIKPKDD